MNITRQKGRCAIRLWIAVALAVSVCGIDDAAETPPADTPPPSQTTLARIARTAPFLSVRLKRDRGDRAAAIALYRNTFKEKYAAERTTASREDFEDFFDGYPLLKAIAKCEMLDGDLAAARETLYEDAEKKIQPQQYDPLATMKALLEFLQAHPLQTLIDEADGYSILYIDNFDLPQTSVRRTGTVKDGELLDPNRTGTPIPNASFYTNDGRLATGVYQWEGVKYGIPLSQFLIEFDFRFTARKNTRIGVEYNCQSALGRSSLDIGNQGIDDRRSRSAGDRNQMNLITECRSFNDDGRHHLKLLYVGGFSMLIVDDIPIDIEFDEWSYPNGWLNLTGQNVAIDNLLIRSPAAGPAIKEKDYVSLISDGYRNIASGETERGIRQLLQALSSDRENTHLLSDIEFIKSKYFPVIEVTAIEPNTVKPSGGQTVTIRGENFTDEMIVRFDDKTRDVKRIDETTVTFVSPTCEPGFVDIELASPTRGSCKRPTAIGVSEHQLIFFQDGISPTADYKGVEDISFTMQRGEQHLQYIHLEGFETHTNMLFRFDLSALPRKALIVSARLDVYNGKKRLDQLHNINGDMTAHSISEDWDPATVNFCNASKNLTWSVPGGAYDSEPLDSFTSVDGAAGICWHSWVITRAARQWSAGAPNNGVLIRPLNREYSIENEYTPSFADWNPNRGTMSDPLAPRLIVEFIPLTDATPEQYRALHAQASNAIDDPAKLAARIPSQLKERLSAEYGEMTGAYADEREPSLRWLTARKAQNDPLLILLYDKETGETEAMTGSLPSEIALRGAAFTVDGVFIATSRGIIAVSREAKTAGLETLRGTNNILVVEGLKDGILIAETAESGLFSRDISGVWKPVTGVWTMPGGKRIEEDDF
ncbi:MAG: DNRLRE domain-containing protein [Planctomycetota bacterium]